MGYPDKLIRCNINGVVAGGEVIVHTVWMRKDNQLFTDDLQTIVNKVKDTWVGTMTGGAAPMVATIASVFPTTLTYTKVTGYQVNSDGRAVAQAEANFPTSGVSGTGTASLPPQCAVAVTLLTSRPGRSGRGRLFLGPIAQSAIGTDGRLTAATRTRILDAMTYFYTELRNASYTNDAQRPVVVSPTLGQSFKIKSVAVGDVIDTMRSRRNALVEAKVVKVVDAT